MYNRDTYYMAVNGSSRLSDPKGLFIRIFQILLCIISSKNILREECDELGSLASSMGLRKLFFASCMLLLFELFTEGLRKVKLRPKIRQRIE